MSRLSRGPEGDLAGFPRVSGDEPYEASLTFFREEFSPRERG